MHAVDRDAGPTLNGQVSSQGLFERIDANREHRDRSIGLSFRLRRDRGLNIGDFRPFLLNKGIRFPENKVLKIPKSCRLILYRPSLFPRKLLGSGRVSVTLRGGWNRSALNHLELL